MKFAHIALLLSICCCYAVAQEPVKFAPAESSVVDEIYLARDDGNGKPGDVVENFTIADIPIYCVVVLVSPDPTTVKMNLVAVKVPGVKPESKVVTTIYTTKQGQNRVYFSGRPDSAWVAGTYRVDVFVDGKQEKTLTFQMSNSGPPTAAMKFAPAKPKSKPLKKN
jgi:hypothetical protein